MVDLHDALANQGLPPLPLGFSPHPPPHAPAGHAPPAALLSMPSSGSRWVRVAKERRSLLVAAAGALLLVLLLLPQLMGESEAEALEQETPASASHGATIVTSPEEPEVSRDPTPAATDRVPAATLDSPQAAGPNPAPDAMQAAAQDAVSGTAIGGPLSEAQAGALLLSGRRAEALTSYRALAQKPGAHPGIEAMVIVLEQKVNPL